MSDRGRRPAGATRGAGAPARRAWWLWLVLAVLVLLALLFVLSRCGQDTGTDQDAAAGGGQPAATDPPGASATASAAPPAATGQATTPPAAPPTAGTAPAAPPTAPGAGPAADGGSLTAGGTALLPLAQAAGADGSLAELVGQQVTADGVRVESVPADEGFWVGSSATDRIWVELEGGGESAYTVRPGDRVSFAGQLVANPEGFARQSGVDADEGAEQLDRQAAHITVPQADLRLTSR